MCLTKIEWFNNITQYIMLCKTRNNPYLQVLISKSLIFEPLLRLNLGQIQLQSVKNLFFLKRLNLAPNLCMFQCTNIRLWKIATVIYIALKLSKYLKELVIIWNNIKYILPNNLFLHVCFQPYCYQFCAMGCVKTDKEKWLTVCNQLMPKTLRLNYRYWLLLMIIIDAFQ